MAVFVCRPLPPRPDFAGTMHPAEAAAMAEHVSYWADLLGAGRVYLYGPVADRAGLHGLAVVEAAEPGEVRAMLDADPVIRAGLGLRYDTSPMLQAMLHPGLRQADTPQTP